MFVICFAYFFSAKSYCHMCISLQLTILLKLELFQQLPCNWHQTEKVTIIMVVDSVTCAEMLVAMEHKIRLSKMGIPHLGSPSMSQNRDLLLFWLQDWSHVILQLTVTC